MSVPKIRWRFKIRWRKCLDDKIKKIFVEFAVIKSTKISLSLNLKPLRADKYTDLLYYRTNMESGRFLGRIGLRIEVFGGTGIGRLKQYNSVHIWAYWSSSQFINFNIKFNKLEIRLPWRLTYHHMSSKPFAILWRKLKMF